jgi:NHLM bacteriocin system ABC transporter peptidase/ATP-binding protein
MARVARKAAGPGRFSPARVKTPSILQMEVTECGAVALAIVLGYYGRHVPIETLRVECGVSRDGSQAVSLLKAARRHGMIARGAKIEELDVLRRIELPCIVFWEFDHFVVLEGSRRNRFFINDPATGPRSVSLEEFDRSFTGIALLIEPGPDFRGLGAPPSLVRPLQGRLEGSTAAFVFVTLAAMALTIPGILVAGLSKVFVDSVLIQEVYHWAFWLILGLVLTALLRGLLTWLQATVMLRLQARISLTHSARFFWHVLHLPATFFQQRYAGDVAERIDANDRIAKLLASEATASIVAVFTSLFYAAAMLLLNWQIGAVAVLVTSANAVVFYVVSRGIADQSRVLLQQQGLLAGMEANGLRAMEALKATACENGFFVRWAGLHAKTINSQQRIELYSSGLEVVAALTNGLATVVLVGYGGFLIMQAQVSVGTLVALQSLLVSFLGPITTILGLGQETQEIKGDLMRLEDGLTQPLDPHLTSEFATAAARCGALTSMELVDVTFGYAPLSPPVIEEVGFSLTPGKRIALVGASGSGKSTLARLACRSYVPWSGRISLGDRPLSEIHPADLARDLAFVDQDIHLFEGTVADNLTLWDAEVSGARLQRAIRDACIDDVIAARGGLLCHLEEGGLNFSGGERQRLEIARALTGDPAVLVLDEATASLDPLLELEIYDNIKRRGCAVLIIAHRLSAVRDCDEIIVLERGRVVARGTHEQLLDACQAYRRLYALESRADGGD